MELSGVSCRDLNYFLFGPEWLDSNNLLLIKINSTAPFVIIQRGEANFSAYSKDLIRSGPCRLYKALDRGNGTFERKYQSFTQHFKISIQVLLMNFLETFKNSVIVLYRGRHSGRAARSPIGLSPVFGLRAPGSGWMSTG